MSYAAAAKQSITFIATMNRLDDEDYEQQNLSDDDNAQFEEDEAVAGEREDPLLLALDDLEGRIVNDLDQFKLHPGIRTNDDYRTVHEELATLLRPVLEVAAHTGPSVARTYFRGTAEGIDDAVENVYERLVSELLLPVLLEVAQSDQIAAKRGAAIEFFRLFYKETQKAGSWLDNTAPPTSDKAGPYGSGGTSGSSGAGSTLPRMTAARRAEKRLTREGHCLRYWIEAANACLTPGVFTDQDSDTATAGRGILAASASLRPALRHIVQRIKTADDRGASRLYTPVMKMVERVLNKLLLSQQPADNTLAASIKFVEIVLLCCSRKAPEPTSSRRGRVAQQSTEDFNLLDLPEGHPVITHEALESIAEYAFSTLRGFILMGGQVKIDVNVLSDMMLTGGSPSEQVVNILKPAALAFLELESTLDPSSVKTDIDYARWEFDFRLNQKSYALAINALSAVALNRPGFFPEAALCLARRTVRPPTEDEAGLLNASGCKVITSQLRASCLTLLRSQISVSSNSFEPLKAALIESDMEAQAEKALAMAKQTNSLRTAGRAARNRANVYYEWDTSATDGRSSKRQRDDLAELRAKKAARGLGSGIKLPVNMSEAVELVLANLTHLPSSRPTGTARPRKIPVTLDFLVDAIMTNGASLSQEDGRWYDRDGGTAWEIDLEATKNRFRPSEKLMESIQSLQESENDKEEENEPLLKRQKLYKEQCLLAAASSVGRILSNASFSRSKKLADFGNQVAARLAFVLKKTQAPEELKPSHSLAQDSSKVVADKLDDDAAKNAERFVENYPLAAAALAMDASPFENIHPTETDLSLIARVLNEALLYHDGEELDGDLLYESGLNVFLASAVSASNQANDKPSDQNRKKAASRITATLQRLLVKLPRLNRSSLVLLTALCDIEAISKKAMELSRRSSQENVSAAAAAHAAKVSSEKRATAVLLILRDIAFQHDDPETRLAAVECAVGVASGRFPSVPSIQDKALKLVMNVLYAKSDGLASSVVEAADSDLGAAKDYAIQSYEEIVKANEEAPPPETLRSPTAPLSDREKEAMDKLRKPVVLYMALALRQPKIIENLFRIGSEDRADVLAKTIRASMAKLARASAAKNGAASTALSVASMVGEKETPLLLSFLEHLSPSPDEELIEACLKIQESKSGDAEKKDPRFIIPVVSSMKRVDLVKLLPEFVGADDNVFLGSLTRMNDRVGRHAIFFREEPDEENPSLIGMSLCEQLVYLHRLDFREAGLSQRRYLDVLKMCIEDKVVFNDRVVMAALDHMSGTFLVGSESLPLAFMRTCMQVVLQHESLHSWIADTLLSRLVEGKVYEKDKRQWEGWMKCAKMLQEKSDEGVRVEETLSKLPAEQLEQYKAK